MRHKSRKKIYPIMCSLMVILILGIIIESKAYKLPCDMLMTSLENSLAQKQGSYKSSGKLFNYVNKKENMDISVNLDNLHSSFAILADENTGKTIAEKRSQEKVYPASLTKIMTAIIIIEEIKDLEQTVTLSPDIFSELYAQNASMAGFMPNETVKAKDLLYGVLLPSGAECCIALADFIAGSERSFAELMNQKAAELGMRHTHFNNCTGLHEENHYTTVEDISVLLKYALKNQTFYEVFTRHRYSTAPTNCHQDGITFYSTMFQYMEQAKITDGEILGGKTGYTEQAGLCLASLAKINGKNYILVTAKADGTHETEPFHILDAAEAYNQIENETERIK